MLSGGGIQHTGELDVRIRAQRRARHRVRQYLAEHDPLKIPHVEEMWRNSDFVVTHTPTEDFNAQAKPKEAIQSHLKGHTLGSIPHQAVTQKQRPGIPANTPRDQIMQETEEDYMASKVVKHTEVMTELVNSTQQNKSLGHQLAAQVLSSSCANTGSLLRRLPNFRNVTNDDQWATMLRVRMGVPVTMTEGNWMCNCNAKEVIDKAYRLEIEGSNIEVCHGNNLSLQPMHGLYCPGRWNKVVNRHDRVRDALAKAIGKFEDIQAVSIEPAVRNARNSAGARADIRVTKGGTHYYLDIGIICPAAPGHVNKLKTHERPGAAADWYVQQKMSKYKDADNYRPIVIETGGRIADASIEFLDSLIEEKDDDCIAKRRSLYLTIIDEMTRQNTRMMTAIVKETARLQ